MARILCVDDYPAGLEAIKRVLEQAGHEVVALSQPGSAPVMLVQTPFDAAVLDFRMPGVDGGLVAKRLKQANPQLPIIMLSAYPADIPEPAVGSVDVFLAKGPATARELLSALAQLLARPQAPASAGAAADDLRRAAAAALQLDEKVVNKWESKR